MQVLVSLSPTRNGGEEIRGNLTVGQQTLIALQRAHHHQNVDAKRQRFSTAQKLRRKLCASVIHLYGSYLYKLRFPM